VEGEQFPELVNWLEAGLTRLEIEAIKARGVSQLLTHVDHALSAAMPPDLTAAARKVQEAWQRPFTEEADTSADILLSALEPYQREVEHHFALEGLRRFHGLLITSYLGLVIRLTYAGSSLTEHIPYIGKGLAAASKPAAPAGLSTFTQACTESAAARQLDDRSKAFANRLLVAADSQGFPIKVLTEPVETVSRTNWRSRYAQAVGEVLQQVERDWIRPRGSGRYLQGTLIVLADWLPTVAFAAALVLVLWQFFDPMGQGYQTSVWHVLLMPPAILLAVLLLLHLLLSVLMPLHWSAIREGFKKELRQPLAAGAGVGLRGGPAGPGGAAAGRAQAGGAVSGGDARGGRLAGPAGAGRQHHEPVRQLTRDLSWRTANGSAD